MEEERTVFESVKKEKIFSADLDGEICHASSIVKADNGEMICAWFQGSVEGADDVKIWGARTEKEKWREPEILAQHSGMPCWNPVLFRLDTGRIILFYKCGREIASWRTMYRLSDDNGRTWSESKELVEGDIGGRGPVRNKPVRLKSGRILAPSSLENGPWRSFADISDDGGITWKKSSEVTIRLPESQKLNQNYKDIPVSEQSYHGRGVIQPTIWESGGKVNMMMRSSEGRIYQSCSEDSGETWSIAEPTEIPNNNSGIDAVCTPDGSVWLVCNPVGESWGKRTPVCLYCLESKGEKWKQIMTLDEGEGEFSYPCIIYDNETLYITYTWKRKNIAFWKLQLKSR